ncbi:MAG TPA: hypothetical protein VGJ26_11525 [Pirellulales bacterium]
MADQEPTREQIEQAAQALGAQESRADGAAITSSLMTGLNEIDSLLFDRISSDVEIEFGEDSMLMPVSAMKSGKATRKEIEVYQGVEAAALARGAGMIRDEIWFANWLAHLRLGDLYDDPLVAQRFTLYRGKSADSRRLTFESLLERSYPEAGKAPVLVYRLFPLAIGIVIAVGFGDHPLAQKLRKQQCELLPNLIECRACHGHLLENGDECRHCGNPLWKFEWLTAE